MRICEISHFINHNTQSNHFDIDHARNAKQKDIKDVKGVGIGGLGDLAPSQKCGG